MGVIRADRTKILPKLLFYILQSDYAKDYFITNAKTTTNISNLTFEDLSDFSFPLPSLNLQQQIVNELESYHQIVDSARNIIEKYKPMIKINPQWQAVSLNELFEATSEIVDPQTKSGTIAYIGLENIEANTGMLVGNVYVDIKTIKSTKRIFTKGDILYGKLRPNLNKVWYAEFDGICSTDIIVLRPKNNDVLATFYAILMREKSFNTMVLNGVSGGQLPRVDTNYLLTLPSYKMSLQEQQQIMTQIQAEQAIIEPSKQLVEVFTKKITDRINEIWRE
jgi:type I restriction enzyme M protein